MSTSKPLRPDEVRELMVRGLRRSLVGPTSDGDISWLGEAAQLKNVEDPSLVLGDYPVGPWCDSGGNEVVHKDPRKIYSVGVLYPVSNEPKQFEPVALDDDDDGEPNPVPEPIADDDPGETAEVDELDPFVNFNKFAPPRSLGITLRPEHITQAIEVHVAGAWYEPRGHWNVTNSWWVRHHFEHTTTITPGGPSTPFSPVGSGLTLTVGSTPRVHDSSHMLTLWIRNDTIVASSQPFTSAMVFQVELSATVGRLQPLNTKASLRLDSLDLLYSSEQLFATGHGCDVSIRETSDSRTFVRTESLPIVELKPLTPDIRDAVGNPLAIGMDDLAALNSAAKTGINKLIDEYDLWLNQRQKDFSTIPENLQTIANDHLKACADFLSDMRRGWGLVQSNPDVSSCLSFASRGMNQQRRAYNAPPRRLVEQPKGGYDVEGVSPHSLDGPQAHWRPFQIAFVLAMLPRFVERRAELEGDSRPDWVSVIWMPTGGGKTEAYLGLAAFVILWERMAIHRKDPKAASSMKVLMRYTYRLLTVQQVSRAASLVCALELIRRNNANMFGGQEIRIGAWLGGSVTPNSRKAAVSQLRSLTTRARRDRGTRFLLVRCPWCGTAMNDSDGRPVGYKAEPVGNESRVIAFCPDSTCDFHLRKEVSARGNVVNRGIPFLEVDEDLYAMPPDFVIGTIDKTARIPWKPEAQSLFGLNHRRNGADAKKRQSEPPALFIQDELHLISGPLGTIDGVFEILLEEFCTQSGGRPPVYVAATATTKNFEGQAAALYRRPARLVPPPGLSIDDSFFARRDAEGPGKVYVGVCATGSMSGLDTQTAVLGSLSYHAAVLGTERFGATTDPWWSNVVFFSSRKALGLLSAASTTSLGQRIKQYRALSGRRSGRKISGGPPDGNADRLLRRNRELTATSSDDINQVLDELSIALPNEQTIDLCMATSMIEVGLDVSRLGLMTVIGQPKTASQYIQATGRVGRSADAVGLVVTVFKTTTPRDLAHYEGFTLWHKRMYASVESASVTPFTREALQRSLSSYMAAMLRMLKTGCAVAPSLPHWNEALNRITAHIPPQMTAERANLRAVANDLLQLAASSDAASYEWDPYCGNEKPLMLGADSEIPQDRLSTPYWRVMNSMRNVDADSLINLKASTPPPQPPPADDTPPTNGTPPTGELPPTDNPDGDEEQGDDF